MVILGLKKLHQCHHECIDLWLAGYQTSDIAKRLGKSINTIKKWLYTEPLTVELKEKKKEDRRQRIEEIKEVSMYFVAEEMINSVQKLAELRDNAKSEMVRYNSAKTLLDYVFNEKPFKLELTGKEGGAIKHEHEDGNAKEKLKQLLSGYEDDGDKEEES